MSIRSTATVEELESVYDEAIRGSESDPDAPRACGRSRVEYEHAIQQGRAVDVLEYLRDGKDWCPNVYLEKPKPDGGKRPVEMPEWDAQLVSSVIRSRIERQVPFHDAFYSRPKQKNGPDTGVPAAVKEIRHKLEGKWVVRADIENFFGSIRSQVLERALDRFLEPDDVELAHELLTLSAVARSGKLIIPRGVEDHGETHGIAQGNSLSCTAARMVIYDLPSVLEGYGQPFIYVDDVLVLSSSQADAKNARDALVEWLGARHLVLGEVDVVEPDETFTYLNQDFQRGPEAKDDFVRLDDATVLQMSRRQQASRLSSGSGWRIPKGESGSPRESRARATESTHDREEDSSGRSRVPVTATGTKGSSFEAQSKHAPGTSRGHLHGSVQDPVSMPLSYTQLTQSCPSIPNQRLPSPSHHRDRNQVIPRSPFPRGKECPLDAVEETNGAAGPPLSGTRSVPEGAGQTPRPLGSPQYDLSDWIHAARSVAALVRPVDSTGIATVDDFDVSTGCEFDLTLEASVGPRFATLEFPSPHGGFLDSLFLAVPAGPRDDGRRKRLVDLIRRAAKTVAPGGTLCVAVDARDLDAQLALQEAGLRRWSEVPAETLALAPSLSQYRCAVWQRHTTDGLPDVLGGLELPWIRIQRLRGEKHYRLKTWQGTDKSTHAHPLVSGRIPRHRAAMYDLTARAVEVAAMQGVRDLLIIHHGDFQHEFFDPDEGWSPRKSDLVEPIRALADALDGLGRVIFVREHRRRGIEWTRLVEVRHRLPELDAGQNGIGEAIYTS